MAVAAKANDDDDDDNDGGGESDSDGDNGGGGGGGSRSDDDDNDEEDDDGDGDDDRLALDDRLAHDDRIDGGCRGPPAPRGRTAVALLSPSGQAPSANATRQSRRLRTPPTGRRTRLRPLSRTEGRRRRRRRRHWRQRWRPMRPPPQPPTPAMLTTFFVKLNNYSLINFCVLGAAANDGMLAFWGQQRTKG